MDDEKAIIEQITMLLDWEALGFEQIYSAVDGLQAMDILDAVKIEIVLCDVEMPCMNGLELAGLIHERWPATQTIIISSHASFQYVQRAMLVGTIEYLLKPVEKAQLSASIEKAKKKILAAGEKQTNQQMAEYWKTYQHIVFEHFWKEAICRESDSTQQEIFALAREKKILLKEGQLYIPMLIDLKSANSSECYVNMKTEFEVRKRIREFLNAFSFYAVCFSPERNRIIGIVHCLDAGSLGTSELTAMLREIEASLSMEYNCILRSCVGVPCTLMQVADEISHLDERLYDEFSPVQPDGWFSIQSERPYEPSISNKIFEKWEQQIEHGASPETIVVQMENHMEQMKACGELTREKLADFQSDFEQILFVLMQKNGLQGHLLFRRKDLQRLRDKCLQNDKAMIRWTNAALRQLMHCINETQKRNPVVEKVKRYVAENLDAPLQRQHIAAQVYLNPDYLDRIFKKHLGMNVSKFVDQMRFKKAKELLMQTDLSISDIAARVGYINTSNFTVFFRNYCGINPSRFRQKTETPNVPKNSKITPDFPIDSVSMPPKKGR